VIFLMDNLVFTTFTPYRFWRKAYHGAFWDLSSVSEGFFEGGRTRHNKWQVWVSIRTHVTKCLYIYAS
jgi:hypothetical protein